MTEDIKCTQSTMECIVVGKVAQRIVGLLLKRNDCLKSQIFRSTTTLGRCDEERDNHKFTAHEGHNSTTNRIYQTSHARLVLPTLTSTTTTATDRPVYPYFIYWENHSANQQPTFTRHNRFYSTAKTIRKKMVSSKSLIFIYF